MNLSTAPNTSKAENVPNTQFCTACGYQNPAHADLCLNCSTVLGSNCPGCGLEIQAGSKFCTQCGTPILDTAPPGQSIADINQNFQALIPAALAKKINVASNEIYGEQREVTVLYVGLEASTAIETLDDEDVYFIKDEILHLLVDIVYTFEGTIDKFTESGLVALFGAPVAHENDPERAVRAAHKMQATFASRQKQLQPEEELFYKLRIGLNTGQVIAGKVGNDLHMDYTVIGETVNLASRLESLAAPGTVLVSSSTYQQTQPLFQFKALPPMNVGWLPEPTPAFELLALSEKSRRENQLPGIQTHMIGRAAELGRLKQALAEVQQLGQSRVAVVIGEAGIGKSRLLAEFRRTITPSVTGVYQGSCLTYARSKPLWVIATLVRDIIGIPESTPLKAQQEALQAYLEGIELANDDTLPYILNALGLEQLDPKLDLRLQNLDPTMLQRQTHTALRQLFLAEAQARTTILIFEDLHWLDPSSKDFLDYLIHTTYQVPLLLVLISRRLGYETTAQPLLEMANTEPEHVVDLQLQPLIAADSQLLTDQLIAQKSLAAWTLKEQIVKRAEGNPLYIEEMFRMLIDQGGLVRDHSTGSWQITNTASELLNNVPGTVKGLLLTRFDRLPEGVRQTLQKTAVIGTSFPVSLVESISPIKPGLVEMHLKELESRQFITAKPFRSEPGYVFCHTLLQETLFSILLKRDRRKIHAQIARAIEQSLLWLPEERAEVLAYHYGESNEPVKAIPYLMTAGENAARRCAYETAIEHYRRAMNLLPDSPDNPSNEFFKIGIDLAGALKFVGEFATASQILSDILLRVWHWALADNSEALSPILIESFRHLADIKQKEGAYKEAMVYLETGLQILGQDAAQVSPNSWRALLDRMAWIYFRQGQLDEAFSTATKATTGLNPTNSDDPGILASLYNTLGGVSWQQGKLVEAVTYVEQSLQLYEAIGYLWGVATAYGNLGILYYNLGNWPQAANYYEQAYAVQQVIGNAEGQAVSCDNLGILHTATGEFHLAQKELELSLSIRRRLGDAWGTAQSHVNLAQAALAQAHIDQAATHAKTALNLADTIGSPEPQIEARWLLALMHAENNNVQSGLALAEEALKMARAAGLLEKEVDCLRALGILRARAGQYKQAEHALERSSNLSREQNDPYRHGLALFELGQVYQHLAKTEPSTRDKWFDKTRVSLNQASQYFESLGATYNLRLTQTALKQAQTGL